MSNNIGNTTTVAIVDDHPVVRYGLKMVLEAEPGFNVVGDGETADEAVDLAARHKPAVMLLDLAMPGGGIEAMHRIREVSPTTRCMILTVCDDPNVAIEALKAGARGYVLKGVSASELRSAIWVVVKDSSFISPEFATRLLQAAQAPHRTQTPHDVLTHRETQIIDEVEKGLTNRQIAVKLNVSEKTVKYYMTSVMQKYNVNNRVSAVVAHRKRSEL